jgi:dTDP-4-amino-4,6-dideoxygalactose transaminase
MEYKIPLFNLNFDDQEEKAVLEVLKSKWISTGPKCEEFESLFCEMLDVKYSISVSNCTNALHLACQVLGLGVGDEVICPSLTFVATANSIRYTGAIPIFCDVKGVDDLNIDPIEIEKSITPKTKAIMLMHFAGFPCDMDAVMNIAKKYNLKVIEDACHGPMSEYKGQKLGTIGDVGCFSFFSNKNISTGEGGMIVTNNEALANKIRLLRSHGMTTMSYQRAKGHATSYDVVEFGYNYRMDDIHAAIGIAQLKKLKVDLEKRFVVRSLYLRYLQDVEGICIPFAKWNEFASNYIMPIVLLNSTTEKREFIRNELHKSGIQTSVHYPAVHQFSAYAAFSRKLAKTEYITNNELTLPMFAALSESDVLYIVESLKEALEKWTKQNID